VYTCGVATDTDMNGQLDGAPMDVDDQDTQNTPDRVQRPSPPPRPRAQSEPFRVPNEFTVGYVYSMDMLIHASLHGHPEQPDRISKIFQAIQGASLLSKMKHIPIRPVYRHEALLVHTEEHWDKVLAIQCECGKRAQVCDFLRLAHNTPTLTTRVSSSLQQ
jgi:histone deacetylase 6